MEEILQNPVLLLIVVALAFVISKLFKLATKAIGIIICVIIAGWLVLQFI